MSRLPVPVPRGNLFEWLKKLQVVIKRHHLDRGELTEVPVPGTPLRRPWRAVTHPRLSPVAALLVGHLVAREGWRPANNKSNGQLLLKLLD